MLVPAKTGLLAVFSEINVKLHQQSSSDLNLVTAYGDGYIDINRVRHATSVCFGPQGPVQAWAPVLPGDLTDNHLGQLTLTRPEVILLGTGSRQCFPAPECLRPLIAAGIGLEVMSTEAAARTFNILASEGRQVLAALLLPVSSAESAHD